jgi:hypothetical protein
MDMAPATAVGVIVLPAHCCRSRHRRRRRRHWRHCQRSRRSHRSHRWAAWAAFPGRRRQRHCRRARRRPACRRRWERRDYRRCRCRARNQACRNQACRSRARRNQACRNSSRRIRRNTEGVCVIGKPDAPTPPNPAATASAATSTNVATAIANANLGQVNQTTPQGNLSYDQTSSYDFTDPVSGLSYSIPKFTATQTLTPEGQATLDQSNAAKYNLAAIGNMSSSQLQQLLGSPINLSSIPQGGDPSLLTSFGQPQGSIAPSGAQQSTFAGAGPITSDYDSTQGALQRAAVENSLFQRMQPQNQLALSHLQSQLADQGIKYGSPAYTAAMDNYNRGINDQQLAITAQGGQEQQLQDNLAAQRAGFANSAEQQVYTQALGRGNFANNAQTSAFQQAATQTQAYNAALAQQQAAAESLFNAQQTARAQALTEQYALRDQPINEISSLLSGSQVTNPNFINAVGTKIPTTDIAGLINNNFSQSLDNYKQQSANYNNIVGGMFGALAGVVKSDVRSKENIHRIGSVFTATPQKLAELPVYRYSYKDDPSSAAHIGPMAQDVEQADPGAVMTDDTGVKYIDKNRVMGGILRAA